MMMLLFQPVDDVRKVDGVVFTSSGFLGVLRRLVLALHLFLRQLERLEESALDVVSFVFN